MAPPETMAECEINVLGLTCSGSARQFVFFLNRQDISEIPGYLKIFISPGSGTVSVRIQYDPMLTDREALIEAVTGPYYDVDENRWRPSPFQVEGVDLLDNL